MVFDPNEARDKFGKWVNSGNDANPSIKFLSASKKYGPRSGIETFMDRFEHGAKVAQQDVPFSKLLKTQPTVHRKGLLVAGINNEYAKYPGPLGIIDKTTGKIHLVDGHHRVYNEYQNGKKTVKVYTIKEN